MRPSLKPAQARGKRRRASADALRTTVPCASSAHRVGGQSAQMDGGRPPVEVEQGLCDIGAVFAKLSMIKSNADCVAGCAHGTGACPADWYPNSDDMCSAQCGVVFEPFCKSITSKSFTFALCCEAGV